MERQPISSTNLSSVGHDESTSVLEVEFVNGSVYEYYDVPREVYEELIRAGSAGSFFAQRIRKTYSFAQI
ncbi:KTSC domain-containing protein [Variovorax sp. CCNWLW186]|uniref:KTSC domain-containing protein n=1 Tax=Variovorax sp. CCNWLW186 TaxID=3127473 RepID=UPI0030AA7FEC